MNLRKFTSAALAAAMTVSSAGVFAEAEKVIAVTRAGDRIGVHIVDDALYNAQEQSYPSVEFAENAKPYIDENGRTQVPIRAVSEAMKFQVDWDGTEQKITLTKDGKTVVMHIGDTKITVSDSYFDRVIDMDTAPLIKNDTTFIPLRHAGEALGYKVDYTEAEEGENAQ